MRNSVRNGSTRAALLDRRGAASLEYALLAAVIAILLSVAVAPFGTALAQEFSDFSEAHLFGHDHGSDGTCRRVEWSEAQLRHLVPSVDEPVLQH